jgi:hypothetical protein
MQDQDLHDILRNLTIRYSEFLEESFHEAAALPRRPVPKVQFDKPGGFSITPEPEPDFQLIVVTSLSTFEKDPTVKGLTDALLRHRDIMHLLSDKGVDVAPGSLSYHVLQPLFTRELVAQKGIKYDDAKFEPNYQTFEEYLHSAEDRYLVFAPLANFDMETETERVGPITIRKLSDAEFVAFNGFVPGGFSRPWDFSFRPFRFTLEMEVTVERGRQPPTQRAQNLFWWLVAAMKLTKAEPTGYDTIWCQPLSWTGMSFGMGTNPPRYAMMGKPFKLAAQDLPNLRGYWNLLEPAVDKDPFFWKIALERFCDAVDRTRADEALVDYWIACESLFGEDVEIGELTYRLSLRIAHFLDSNPTERERIRAVIKEAYRVRGRLLHGARKTNPTELTEQTLAMKEITKRAISRCLEDHFQSRGDMIQRIESSILGATPKAP